MSPSLSKIFRRRNFWIIPGIVVAVLALTALAGRAFDLAGALARLEEWIHGLGLWAPLGFVLVYALVAMFAVPGSVILLTMTSGAMFGLGWGTVYAFLGAWIGSLVSFVISRHTARGWVRERIDGREGLEALDRAIGRRGLWIMILLRVSLGFPFVVLSYGVGLTRVRMRDYMLSGVGFLPGSLFYAYCGVTAQSVAAIVAGDWTPERGWGYYALMGVGLLATMTAVLYMTELARRTLARAAEVSAQAPEGGPPDAA